MTGYENTNIFERYLIWSGFGCSKILIHLLLESLKLLLFRILTAAEWGLTAGCSFFSNFLDRFSNFSVNLPVRPTITILCFSSHLSLFDRAQFWCSKDDSFSLAPPNSNKLFTLDHVGRRVFPDTFTPILKHMTKNVPRVMDQMTSTLRFCQKNLHKSTKSMQSVRIGLTLLWAKTFYF